MNRIRRFRSTIVFAVLALLALPSDARAGFDWIGWWKADTKITGEGGTNFLSTGIELPDGVIRVEGEIRGHLGFSQPWGSPFDVFPPFDVWTSSSLELSRPFRLSGSPGGWKIDLDWHVVDSMRFWAHVDYSGPFTKMVISTMGIDSHPVFASNNGYGGSVILPDGDYMFTAGASGSLHFERPRPEWPRPYSVYSGDFRYRFQTGLLATAVPEPASWLMIGQGCFAATGIMVVSKRRQRQFGRTASG